MKPLFRSALLGATFLTALVACEREMTESPNPNYNAADNSVTAKFYFNINTNDEVETRTTANYAQLNHNFLGMEAVHMLAFNLPYMADIDFEQSTSEKHRFFFNPYNFNSAQGEAVSATRDYDFGSLFAPGDITATNQSRTLEMALPLGTNAVMFYGKAYKDKNSLADEYQGKVVTKGNPTNLTSLEFIMSPRASLDDTVAYNAACFLFSNILTSMTVCGLVDERNFFLNEDQSVMPTGPEDRSYRFWFPINDNTPQITKVDPEDGITPLLDNGTPIPNGYKTVVGSDEYTFYTGQVSWKQMGLAYDYAHDNNPSTDPLRALYLLNTVDGIPVDQGLPYSSAIEMLGELYSRFTTIKESGDYKELRSGSAGSILHTLRDLSTVVEKIVNASPTTWPEQVAKLLATHLQERIYLFFAGSGSSLTYRDIGTIRSKLAQYLPTDVWSPIASAINSLSGNVLSDANASGGFPTNLGLPIGAAVLGCKKGAERVAEQFSYVRNVPAYGMGGVTFDVFNYVYPAELMYFGNSGIRTTSAAAVTYPNTLTDWKTASMWNGWTSPGKVESTTTHVAMVEPLNYGSALCESVVKYKSGVTKLRDNRHALFPDEKDNVINVDSLNNLGKGFSVTGVVIGGQPGAVGWDYTICADSLSYKSNYGWSDTDTTYTGLTYTKWKFDKMIYDKVTPAFRIGDVSNSAYSTDKGGSLIYTLCFDNYDPLKSPSGQNDVYVALELVNNTGQNLWGELNMVRNGGTFYLVGKMDLHKLIKAAKTDATSPYAQLLNYDPTDYHYPPYHPTTGRTIKIPRVFMQDFMTTANLILDADCLKHAYVTVPDLKSSQVSLGLSIDINWNAGLEFDVNMGTLE